jgi:hypothetical protein
MPSMDWDTFQDAHYRPHLVVATLEGGAARGSAEERISLLQRLVEALGVSGNYAIKKDGANIRAVFESDVDATRFAKVLLAKPAARDPESASNAVARMDRATQRNISAALKQSRLKNAKKR